MKSNKVIGWIILFIAIAGLGGGIIFYMNNTSDTVTTFDVSSLPYKIAEKDLSNQYKGVEGSFVLYDTIRDKYTVYNKEEVLQQTAPGETFGLFNTLVGLEEGVLKDTSKIKSIKESAKLIDKTNFEKYIKATGYGNANMSSGIDDFWQKSLKISPLEQVEFLRKLYAGETNFSGSNFEAAKEAMLIGEVKNGVLYGLSDHSQKDTIVYVGSYEKRGNTYIYAARIKGENINEKLAEDTVVKALNYFDAEIAKVKSKNMNVVYEVPNMSRVQAKKNIIYKTYGETGKLGFDIYSPLNGDENKKAYPIIMIHGAGGSSIKDTGCYNSWGKIGAASGYATIVFDWRAYDRQSAEANAGDITDAIKYIREHADNLNINPDHMSIFAFSAGVKHGVKKALEADTGFIDSIVEYYGELPVDLLDNADIKKLPPMFLADAAWDDVINKKVNDEFYNKAIQMKYQITRMIHPDGSHGFEIFNDDMSTYEIIEKSLEFVETNRKDI
jgi:bla regulator protein BlaR1